LKNGVRYNSHSGDALHRPRWARGQSIARRQPARTDKQQPVTPLKRRSLDPPTKHRRLMSEHRILDLQHGNRRASRQDAKQPRITR
jgi:hypothetical protein